MARWYFAWVDADDDEWIEDFAREDEEITAITRDHAEGDFASLTIEIRNPRVGLLAPSRKTWAWLAYENATDILPFFFGEIVGFPEDVQAETVSLLFVAKPSDVLAQKTALAATLREPPFYDPVFINPDDKDKPDVLLDARPYRWHFDPVTHEVSISHIVSAEDGIIAFGEAEVLYDDSSFSYSQPPLAELKIEAKVNWTQRAKGTVDVTRWLLDAGVAAGSTNYWMLQSYTMDGLVGAWPLPDGDIGGGWEIEDTDAIPGKNMPLYADSLVANVYIEPEESATDAIIGAVQPQALFPQTPKRVEIPLGQVQPVFVARYEAERSRSETLSITLTADVQRLTTEPASEEIITLESNDVSEPVDEVDSDSDGSSIPIGDVRRNSYFKTDRGYQSAEYVLAFGGTIMLRRARAVELSFTVPFDAALDVTLRKEVLLTHRLLPGGVASGKVIATSLNYSADEQSAQVTIGCCVGRGGTLVANEGEPTYVDDDYVDLDYQARTGEQRLVLPQLLYSTYDDAEIDDDGYNFLSPVTADDALNYIVVQNGPTAQRELFGNMEFSHSQDEIVAKLNTLVTVVCVNFRTVTGGPYEITIPMATEDMLLPRSIDLEESTA